MNQHTGPSLHMDESFFFTIQFFESIPTRMVSMNDGWERGL